jgi:Zn-finger nucleic acid-binding protein
MSEGLRCPACAPSPVLADIGAALQVEGLHRCAECRGVLASHRSVEQARRHVTSAHPALRMRQAPHRCRRCQDRAKISATHCARCAAPLVLACPKCRAPMAALEVLGIVVDVCRACELTYFDAGEFAHACHSPKAFARAVRPPAITAGTSAGGGIDDGVDVVELALYAPDAVEVIAYGAQVAGHVALDAASHVAHATASVDVVVVAQATGKAALGAARVATEVADSAGETILEVLASLFDGL